ncbi:MAG: type II toxin-antitoxin system HipA family toxin [Polyangiaceae bacterium]|nr:type II toxin-antitoxin system HipA family toxin [Polyangiaceae bacterium]
MVEDRGLDVLLGDLPVGRLSISHGTLTSFTFFEAYRTAYPRPVLGQLFEDDLRGKYVGKDRLPVWFSNLLPEGVLRTQVQADIGKKKKHEIEILRRLANDLPGAVRAISASTEEEENADLVYTTEARTSGGTSQALRFSLAGVQLKFSVLRNDHGGLTLPASGINGDWIVKLPDPRYSGVPINEYTMMTWARLAGLNVPEVTLESAANLENIPSTAFAREEPVFAIRRFDRGVAGTRFHIEDFAQIFGLYPDDKYLFRDYTAIAKVIFAVAGAADLTEYLRRLVFMAAIGNADMHHKNWSLIYPDQCNGRLTPAYDLLGTVVYPDVSNELALKLNGSRRWEDVRQSSLTRLIKDAGGDETSAESVVNETIDALIKTRPDAADRSTLSKADWGKIADHWKRVPLLKNRVWQ